eukprot:560412-Rhodomonas_salina.5
MADRGGGERGGYHEEEAVCGDRALRRAPRVSAPAPARPAPPACMHAHLHALLEKRDHAHALLLLLLLLPLRCLLLASACRQPLLLRVLSRWPARVSLLPARLLRRPLFLFPRFCLLRGFSHRGEALVARRTARESGAWHRRRGRGRKDLGEGRAEGAEAPAFSRQQHRHLHPPATTPARQSRTAQRKQGRGERGWDPLGLSEGAAGREAQRLSCSRCSCLRHLPRQCPTLPRPIAPGQNRRKTLASYTSLVPDMG